jgi:hydrogenase-4 component F
MIDPIYIYLIIGAIILAIVAITKSHKIMNVATIILPATFIGLSVYTLNCTSLPGYFGSDSYLFIDHLGLYEIIISAVLFMLAAIYCHSYIEGSIEMGEMSRKNLKPFYLSLNMLLVIITFAFFSNNLALFWILAELSTVFSALLVAMLNARKNIGSALKYIFITSTCMVFSFIGLILLFAVTQNATGVGTLNWNLLMAYANQFSAPVLFASFVLTFVGFAAKSGIVPFHAWLPSAHSKAPAPISAILSGSITSVGIYGIIRMYAIVAQTSLLPKISILLIVFGILSMVVDALTMLSQVNLKKLIGYSTIEQMGFLLIGLGIGTPEALYWTIFFIMAHAFAKALLLFSAGIFHHQYRSVRMEKISNAFKLQPFATWSLILGALAIIGVPLFIVFVPKISILIQTLAISPVLLIGVLFAFLFAEAAFGTFFIKLISRKTETADVPQKFKVPLGMKLPIILLLIIIVALGVYFPQALTDLLNQIVKELGFVTLI